MGKRTILAVGAVTAVILLALPVFLNTTAPFCGINSASAQDNPCAAQEATNSALIIENSNLQATIASQPLVITVEVIVTATPIQSPTPDETSLADENVSLTATALPEGCILHVVQSGDTPFGIAEAYSADPFAMLSVNGLDDVTATQLQIGDILIVPLEGCPIEAFSTIDSPTLTATVPDATATTEPVEPTTAPIQATPTTAVTPSATIPLPPTSSSSQLNIGVADAGDLPLEGVVILNEGNTLNISGWILSDEAGNEYTFPEVILFSNAALTLYTRAGDDTPVARFWGLDTPIWESGDTLTLADADGTVQVVYQVP